ncbi:hypothetical protein AB7C87_04570 [Natrarchaeobius sp. A-rgal3]|uniref:hypothetical protein n=1 Tax=Natrarchaeobius versutus TaxID=1679078 RepID=UPI00350F3690
MDTDVENDTERILNGLVDRSAVPLLAFFVAFYPLSILLGSVVDSVWEIPVLGTAYAVYFTLAFTIPAALTIPVTEALMGTNVYYAGTGLTVVALGTCYLGLSLASSGLYRAVNRFVRRRA